MFSLAPTRRSFEEPLCLTAKNIKILLSVITKLPTWPDNSVPLFLRTVARGRDEYRAPEEEEDDCSKVKAAHTPRYEISKNPNGAQEKLPNQKAR